MVVENFSLFCKSLKNQSCFDVYWGFAPQKPECIIKNKVLYPTMRRLNVNILFNQLASFQTNK